MEKQMNKRQLQYQQTQDAIYAAVNELVEEMRFDKIRIQDICSRAGISLGAFYHYFSSKNDLMIDRYHRSNRFYRNLYEEELVNLPPVDALKRLFVASSEYAKTRLPKILVPYFMAYLENAPKWSQSEKSAFSPIVDALLEKGLAEGSIRTAHTKEQLKLFLTAFSNGMVSYQCVSGGVFLDNPDALAVLLDFLESLRAEA